MRRKIYILPILLTLLTACEKEINYTGDFQKPKLVLHAMNLQENSSEIGCHLMHSTFFLDRVTYQDLLIKDATVTAWRNGEKMTLQESKDIKGYYSVLCPTPHRVGDIIRIQASVPDYPTVEGTDTIVPMPKVELLTAEYDSVENSCKVRVRFGDNSAYKGMVGCQAVLNTMWRQWQGTGVDTTMRQVYWITSMDKIFAGNGNAFSAEYGYNAGGELFVPAVDASNREVEFTMPTSYMENRYTKVRFDTLTLNFITHSTHSYRYWKSMYAYRNVQGSENFDFGEEISMMIGSEEKVQLYSNVENGYGIIRAASIQTYIRNFTNENE